MVVNEHAVVNPRTEKYASARGIKAQRPQLFLRFSSLHFGRRFGITIDPRLMPEFLFAWVGIAGEVGDYHVCAVPAVPTPDLLILAISTCKI